MDLASKRRIENIEKVLDNHFKKLEIETLDDYAGIRQWFHFHIYSIENLEVLSNQPFFTPYLHTIKWSFFPSFPTNHENNPAANKAGNA